MIWVKGKAYQMLAENGIQLNGRPLGSIHRDRFIFDADPLPILFTTKARTFPMATATPYVRQLSFRARQHRPRTTQATSITSSCHTLKIATLPP